MKWNDLITKYTKTIKGVVPIVTPIIFVLACITFYFMNNALLGSFLLIIFIVFNITNYVVKETEEDNIAKITERVEQEIKNNIMNLISPVALIRESR